MCNFRCETLTPYVKTTQSQQRRDICDHTQRLETVFQFITADENTADKVPTLVTSSNYYNLTIQTTTPTLRYIKQILI